MYEIGPSDAALFFSELTATYSVRILPTAVEIWALEGYNVVLVLKHPGFHLDGGAEFWDWMYREITDSCGLELFSEHMVAHVIGKDPHPM